MKEFNNSGLLYYTGCYFKKNQDSQAEVLRCGANIASGFCNNNAQYRLTNNPKSVNSFLKKFDKCWNNPNWNNSHRNN